MVTDSKKKFLTVMIVLAILSIIVMTSLAIGLVTIKHWYNEQTERDQKSVRDLVTAKAIEACNSSISNNTLCNDMEVTISESECEGRVCWTAYATPRNDRTVFYASMLIERNGTNYSISEYNDSV